MIWANLLHFYQPPTQKKYWIDRITSESYRRLVEGFLRCPSARVTLNINAVLFEFWDRYGHKDLLEGLRKLLARGQIELTGTAKYHPILPKLSEKEIIRQIELNDEGSRKYLGNLYQPRGFFPPEMAYDRKVARVAASLGYKWIIAEELSLSRKFGVVDYSKIYEVEGVTCPEGGGERLKILFRERDFSYKILSGQLGTPKLFLDALGDRVSRNEYLLTAMDGETFGHHRPGMDRFLIRLLEMSEVQAVLISELPNLFERGAVVETLPSTWALMGHDLEKNIPFARWEDPDNEIHQMQWELTNLAIAAVRNSKHQIPSSKQAPNSKSQILSVSNSGHRSLFGACDLEFGISGRGQGKLTAKQLQWLEARRLLDKALHSDQYWWASARPWWSLEMIERGAKDLRDVVHTVPDVLDEAKNMSQNLYYGIITTGFNWQRDGKIDEIAKSEDEAVRMRTDERLPELPSEEIDRMVVVIEEEMIEVARNQEYERAAQLRDRIKELQGYKKSHG